MAGACPQQQQLPRRSRGRARPCVPLPGPALRRQSRASRPFRPHHLQPLGTPAVGGGRPGRAHASRERGRPPPCGCRRDGGAMVRLQASSPDTASLPQHYLGAYISKKRVQVSAPPLSAPNRAHLVHWRLCCTSGWAPMEAAAAQQGTQVVYLWRLVQRHSRYSPAGGLVFP